MNILIVCATFPEIEPILRSFAREKELSPNHTQYTFLKHRVDLLITGLGMVHTAFYLAKKLPGEYNFVINAGIAGSFDRNLKIGEVVNVVRDTFSELGAEDGEEFLSIKEMGFGDIMMYQNNIHPFKSEELEQLKKVNGITVNKVHGNIKSIEKIQGLYHPSIESMEGAAFLFACAVENIPCIQVRAISNYVEKRDKSKWNIPLAIENLNKKILEIIKSL